MKTIYYILLTFICIIILDFITMAVEKEDSILDGLYASGVILTYISIGGLEIGHQIGLIVLILGGFMTLISSIMKVIKYKKNKNTSKIALWCLNIIASLVIICGSILIYNGIKMNL